MHKSLKILIFVAAFAAVFGVAKNAYAASEFTSIVEPDNGAGTG